MYNEFSTYFNRIFSIITFYNHYSKPDKIDEIGEKVLKRYFPSGRIEDNSHMEAVKVRNYFNIHENKNYKLSMFYGYFNDRIILCRKDNQHNSVIIIM